MNAPYHALYHRHQLTDHATCARSDLTAETIGDLFLNKGASSLFRFTLTLLGPNLETR